MTFTDRSTVGDIYFDDKFLCYSLEDTCRTHGSKIAGHTAIPAGEYEVIVSHSGRFGIETPLLLNVPGFEGIRIHPGNTASDTEGCILPGKTKKDDFIGDSRVAYNELFEKIRNALKDGPLSIAIYGGIHIKGEN